jgi:hypothetical protein
MESPFFHLRCIDSPSCLPCYSAKRFHHRLLAIDTTLCQSISIDIRSQELLRGVKETELGYTANRDVYCTAREEGLIDIPDHKN